MGRADDPAFGNLCHCGQAVLVTGYTMSLKAAMLIVWTHGTQADLMATFVAAVVEKLATVNGSDSHESM